MNTHAWYRFSSLFLEAFGVKSSQNVYCYCRQDGLFGTMIKCDGCRLWYHRICEAPEALADTKTYTCAHCKLKQQNRNVPRHHKRNLRMMTAETNSQPNLSEPSAKKRKKCIKYVTKSSIHE